jgi:hypothetical protein
MPADALDLAIANGDKSAINFSPMDIFAKGVQAGQQTSLATAFSGGLPKLPDGSTDYSSIGNTYIQNGQPATGVSLANLGLQRQLFNSAMQPQQGSPPGQGTPQGQSSAPSGSYAANTYGAESGNNPNARNPNSTAGGLAQFTDPTWADLAQRHPELKLTPGGQYDPQQVARALPVFTQENASALQSAGIQPTDPNLRVAHLLGAQGATGFLTSMAQNPNAPAASMVGPAAVKANQSLFFGQGGQPVSAQDFYARVTQGFGGSPGVSGQPAPGVGQQQGSAQPLIMGQYTPAQAQQQAQALFQKGTALNLVKPGAGEAMVDQAKTLMEAAAKTFAPSRNVSDYMVGHLPGESFSDFQARTAGQTETAKKFAEITGDQYKKAGDNYQAAQATLYRLGIIDHSIDALGPNWMGAGANLKAGVAKSWNSVAQLLPDGMASKFQIDPNKVATWEDINKQTTNLGFELAKTLGSREAQMIVQQSISSVPGAQQTYLGSKLVSASLRQAAQRQQDYYEYLGQHPGQVGADIAFNQTHPIQQYVNNAVQSIGGQQGGPQQGQPAQAAAPKLPGAGSVVVQNGVRFQIQPDGTAKALQ